MTVQAIESEWLRSLARAERPCAQSLKDHLIAVHRQHAGFTESCAGRCRDHAGRTSYEWLAELVDGTRAGNLRILDLACGSGPLLSVCAERHPDAQLVGVDMSPHELALARARLGSHPVDLHLSMAQELGAVESGSVDAVLCHWALTLMDPVEPVLAEVARVLRGGGVFAAIVDGLAAIAPGYAAIDETVFAAVSRVAPLYGTVDLGDPRVREPDALAELARAAFPGAAVRLEPSVMRLSGPPADVAREAAGFFYASFVLPPRERADLIAKLTQQLGRGAENGEATFNLPVTRLQVRLRASN